MMRPSNDFPSVYLCREHVDFRKGINGLSLIVEQALSLNPFEETLFVFCNRQRSKIKILYWERNGFCLWQKRLEQDRFKWHKQTTQEVVTLTGQELNWLLDGFDIWQKGAHRKLYFQSTS